MSNNQTATAAYFSNFEVHMRCGLIVWGHISHQFKKNPLEKSDQGPMWLAEPRIL